MRLLLSVMMILGAAAPAAAQLPPPSAELNAAFEAARAASPTAPQLEAEQREWLHYRALDEYGHGADGDELARGHGEKEDVPRRADARHRSRAEA